MRHAFTGYVYESQDDGNVRIEDPSTGRVGIYTPAATLVSGDVLAVDHHMCGHVGGRTAVGGSFPSAASSEPADSSDPQTVG